MAETDKDLNDLEALFAKARQAPPAMPQALNMRILEDAAEVQAERRAAGSLKILQQVSEGSFAVFARRLWGQFSGAVGGWPTMGGLAAASAAGLWIGLAPPSFMPDPVLLAQLSADTASLPFDSYDLAVMLGEETQ